MLVGSELIIQSIVQRQQTLFGICSFVHRGVKGWDWLAGFLKVPYRVDPRRILTPTHQGSIIFTYKIRVKKFRTSHRVTSLFKIFPWEISAQDMYGGMRTCFQKFLLFHATKKSSFHKFSFSVLIYLWFYCFGEFENSMCQPKIFIMSPASSTWGPYSVGANNFGWYKSWK